jgi:hypothetical protein
MSSRRWRKQIKRAGQQVKRSAKKAGQQVGRSAKYVGRQSAPVLARTIPYATGVAAAVGSFVGTVYFGPLAGAAVGAGITGTNSAAAYYFGATAARKKGERGREAREEGRKVRRRTAVAGAAGTAVGTFGGSIYTWAATPSATGAYNAAAEMGLQSYITPAASSGLGLTTSGVVSGLLPLVSAAANYYAPLRREDITTPPYYPGPDDSGYYRERGIPGGAGSGSDVPGGGDGGLPGMPKKEAAPGEGKPAAGFLVAAGVGLLLLMKAA